MRYGDFLSSHTADDDDDGSWRTAEWIDADTNAFYFFLFLSLFLSHAESNGGE